MPECRDMPMAAANAWAYLQHWPKKWWQFWLIPRYKMMKDMSNVRCQLVQGHDSKHMGHYQNKTIEWSE